MRSRFGLLVMLVLCAWGRETPAQSPATRTVAVIAAADAGCHVGQERVVEMVVRGSRRLPDKEICFLNSRPDHEEKDNFTAVIFRAGLARFASDGIADPAAHYRDKTIRVTGRIEEHQGRPQIKVENPGQIEVVAKDAAD